MDKIFRLIKKHTKHSYIQQEMFYFYSSKMFMKLTTVLFDLNNHFWRHSYFKFEKHIPVWKLCYLFPENDFPKVISSHCEFLYKHCFGKVLRIIINDKPCIMILFYCIGNERSVLKQHNKYKNILVTNELSPKLDYSKRIDNNSFLSQGEGYHRYECEKNQLSFLFTGENYYKYK